MAECELIKKYGLCEMHLHCNLMVCCLADDDDDGRRVWVRTGNFAFDFIWMHSMVNKEMCANAKYKWRVAIVSLGTRFAFKRLVVMVVEEMMMIEVKVLCDMWGNGYMVHCNAWGAFLLKGL